MTNRSCRQNKQINWSKVVQLKIVLLLLVIGLSHIFIISKQSG